MGYERLNVKGDSHQPGCPCECKTEHHCKYKHSFKRECKSTARRTPGEGVFEGVNSGAAVSGGRLFCPPLTSQVRTAMSIDMRTALSRFLAAHFCTLKLRLSAQARAGPKAQGSGLKFGKPGSRKPSRSRTSLVGGADLVMSRSHDFGDWSFDDPCNTAVESLEWSNRDLVHLSSSLSSLHPGAWMTPGGVCSIIWLPAR